MRREGEPDYAALSNTVPYPGLIRLTRAGRPAKSDKKFIYVSQPGTPRIHQYSQMFTKRRKDPRLFVEAAKSPSV